MCLDFYSPATASKFYSQMQKTAHSGGKFFAVADGCQWTIRKVFCKQDTFVGQIGTDLGRGLLQQSAKADGVELESVMKMIAKKPEEPR